MADTNLIIRADHKNEIAAFNTETRAAIDRAIVAFNDLAKKSGKDAAAAMREQAIATYLMAKDEKALEKAGFETFKDAAKTLVHLAPANATQYRKAGEFILSENAPQIVHWYSPSTLYLFTSKKIPVDTINDAINSGELKEDMLVDNVKAWIAAHDPKALTDGEEAVSIAKMFDASITHSGGTFGFTGTLDDIKDKMRECVSTDTDIEDDRFGTFNPHAELDNGKKKVNGKGIVLVFGAFVVTATYFPTGRAKASPTEKTVAAQNETIAKLMARIAELEANSK